MFKAQTRVAAAATVAREAVEVTFRNCQVNTKLEKPMK